MTRKSYPSILGFRLPIENAGGGYVIAEATVSGKKKDAVFQCALEACRILDRSGMLKQSNQGKWRLQKYNGSLKKKITK